MAPLELHARARPGPGLRSGHGSVQQAASFGAPRAGAGGRESVATSAIVAAAATGTAPGLTVRGGDNTAASVDGDVHGVAVFVVCLVVSTTKNAGRGR